MADKILVIAEKPSVAADLVKVLPGKFTKSKTHYESSKYIVSYAIGHLVSICYPEEIDPKYKSWGLNLLPILPDKFPLKGLSNTKSQLNALQKLIRRQDVKEIINACDAGREGELIFQYIIDYVWNKTVARKSFKRLWLQSMTKDAIQEGFNTLREKEEMASLHDTALCRSESDWLIGLNATRALTSYNSRNGGFMLTPCGRVQTPTLSMLVKREKERQEFVPRPYFTLHGSFSWGEEGYDGKWIDPDFKKDEHDPYLKKDRIWDEDKARDIIKRCTGQSALVTETSKKSSQNSPPLYDLTSLQREANSRFGFSAKNTLGLAQALYERHKVLTYPRTDSRCLPEDYLPQVKETIGSQRGWQLNKFAQIALENNYLKKNRRIFNNAKISDHHAIIPTTKLPGSLSEPEYKIYLMVVQRFMAVFFPPARYLNTTRLSVTAGETFLTEGKILVDPGWKIIYGDAKGSGKDVILSPVPKEAAINCRKVELEETETRPPARFNEATLLSAMENSNKLIDDEELADAMKERGLGTPATRAAIIEKLIKDNYLAREGRELVPTGKALELLAILEAMKIEVLASPEMTGEWEHKLNQILKGSFTRQQFMKEIRDLTGHIISQVKSFEKDSAESKKEAAFSPVNELRFFDTPNAYTAEDGSITIRKILGGRAMKEAEIIDLLHGKTLGPFDDFRSRKSGKTFAASVKLTNNKVEFIFANDTANLDIESITNTSPLGISPIDHSEVFETPGAYMSKSALEGDNKNGLKISKIILSRKIEAQHIQQLLEQGRTELIKGFISKKKRPFDAFLILDKKGKISWEFPPRKPRRKK